METPPPPETGLAQGQDILDRQRTDEAVRRLASIVENSADAIISKTLDGIITSWNPAAENMFGYSASEIIGQPLQIIVPLDRSHEESEILAGFARGEVVRHLDTVRIRKNGQRLDVSVTISPIKDSKGRIVGASKIVRDITGHKQAERALKESESRYRSLFENMLEGYAYCQMLFEGDEPRDFLYLDVNKTVTELTGLKDVVGKKVSEIIPGIRESNPEMFEVYGRVALNGKRESYETYVKPLGIWFSVSIYSPAKGYFIAVFDNITERKQAEESLRLLNTAVLQSKELIVITDANLDLPGPTIIFANPAFTQMTGYTAEEVIGKTPRILQGPLTDKKVLRRLRSDLERGEVFQGESINYRKDGTTFNLEWQVSPLRDAGGTVTHFVSIQHDITDRKRIEARFRLLVDSNVQGVLFWNRNGDITGANDAFLRLVGYSREDLEAGRINWMALTPPEYSYLDQRCLEEVAAKGFSTLYEKEYILRDGSRVPILLGAAAFADNPDEGVCFVVDLTERNRLEARVFQSQRMETVAKLAGGVAHEFNSILTAIIGQSESLLSELPENSPQASSAAEISRAAGRAAILTRQLLAYGGKQILQPENLNLNGVLATMGSALRHLAGEDTDMRIIPAAGLKAVNADVGQLTQVIMNMVMNAVDAMPKGGKLTLETANVTLDHDSVSHVQDLKAGEYVMLAITDTGRGMSDEVRARAFEPFFSTKEVGEGAGLGLSTSYGIIKQSGGHINVYSELARGTTFKVYLPQVESQITTTQQLRDSSDLPRGTETILLVEDNPSLRKMASSLLARLGYTVLTAANGIEALSLQKKHGDGRVDLLFTDLVMPHMSGRELSEKVLAENPGTKILFTTAYTEKAILHQGALNEGATLLQKPFTPAALAHKLRKVLD